MKRLLTPALSAAIALSATSAFAQNHSFTDAFNAPRAVEANVGFRVPLGGPKVAAAKPSYGASLGFTPGGGTLSQSTTAPTVKFADLSFSGGKVEEARLGALNFAKTDAADVQGDKLGFDSGSYTPWVWGGIVVIGLYLLLANNNNDRHHPA